MPDIDVDFATAWRDNLLDVLRESVDVHGGDVDALLDSRRFVESLDQASPDDIGDSDFAERVAELAREAVDESPALRVIEAVEPVEEAVESVPGRVLEAKGTNADGGRVFRVNIIESGTSRNGNHYTPKVLRDAARLYEGAKAYDHHRTPEELRSSTLAGLVGSYRDVEATPAGGLDGNLHLLPGATHTAEALDRAIENQNKGLPPLVGISHDVMANFATPRSVGGRRVREATSITAVQSADVVADPSAGGKAIHAVESTQTPTGVEHTQESEVPVNKTDVLAAFKDASDDELAAVGLSRTGTPTTESVTPPERVVENTQPDRVTEGGAFAKTSFLGRTLIRAKAEDAGLDRRVVESAMPDRFTETEVDEWIAAHKGALAVYERAGLEPRNAITVTRESTEKKQAALDAFFAGNFRNGYNSFREAFVDFTGRAPRAFTEDFNRIVLRESFGGGFSSAMRTTESMDSSTWAQALGDSITRRMIAEYSLDNLGTWRKVVRIVPVQDFRTQRRVHLGGYGTLPTVLEGGPYQPLTSPGDEEATYAIAKRGGTEDVTLEMIANDDVRAISRIPGKLGRAAARTVYEYVWAFFSGNATYVPDATAWFHTNHANTDTSAALSQTTLSTGRRKMIEQTAYGDSSEVLGIPPRYLIVPPELEELAFQLTSSRVAVPATAAGPSDTPNIHSAMGLEYILVPSFTDANDWFLLADPGDIPSIELGFYQGREEPELFTQADQTVGSMFDSDRWTIKIRHIYNGTIEDYRSGYRGQG